MNMLLILTSVLLNCAAQLFIRKGILLIGEVGMAGMARNAGSMLADLWLWAAMLCYAVGILMWMAVLPKVEESFAYPFLSVGYVMAAIASYCFFGGSLAPARIAEIVAICPACF